MRSHPIYKAFERRWGLGVYWQMRWKEVVSKVEAALSSNKLVSSATTTGGFATIQAEAVYAAMLSCWSAEVYIPELGWRFWRFTLQLVGRYKTWLEGALPETALDGVAMPSTQAEKVLASAAVSRAATPTPSQEPASAEANAADEVALQQFVAAIVDVRALDANVRRLWKDEISVILPSSSIQDIAGEGVSLEGMAPFFMRIRHRLRTRVCTDALDASLATLTSLTPPLSSQIVAILAKRCCDALIPVRSVPSQFRAMSSSTSSRRAPSEPSHFIPNVFRPIREFFAIGSAKGSSTGKPLREAYAKEWVAEVFEVACGRYAYYLAAMKKTEESLKRLKRGQTSAFSLFGRSGGNQQEDERRDEERIRVQTILDVNAFGKDAESLGVDILACRTFVALQEMAHNTTG